MKSKIKYKFPENTEELEFLKSVKDWNEDPQSQLQFQTVKGMDSIKKAYNEMNEKDKKVVIFNLINLIEGLKE